MPNSFKQRVIPQFVVYIAGCYRAATEEQLQLNIEAATARGEQVIQDCPGWFPYIPHKATAGMDALACDAYFLRGHILFLLTCDALLLLPGWENSAGTRDEVELAKEYGIPIVYSVEELGRLDIAQVGTL